MKPDPGARGPRHAPGGRRGGGKPRPGTGAPAPGPHHGRAPPPPGGAPPPPPQFYGAAAAAQGHRRGGRGSGPRPAPAFYPAAAPPAPPVAPAYQPPLQPEVAAVGVLEASARYAERAPEGPARDAAVDAALGACARALGRGELALVAACAAVAARVARLASGAPRSLPHLAGLADAVVGWALDAAVPRRSAYELVDALGAFGPKAWLAERDTAVQLARHLDADLGLLARACGDDAAAARCASVARCLAAVVKCAPFASGAIPGLASRFVESLQAARPAVSDGDAWDDLGHDLGGAVVRAVPFDDAFPDAFGALAQRYAAAAAEALDSFAADDASSAARRRAAKRARKHCDRFAHLLERCLQSREREASLVLDALVVHQRCAGPLRPLKSAADKARKALRAALAARPAAPSDDAKEGARVDECRSKLCKALSRVAAFSRRPEAPRLAAVESDDQGRKRERNSQLQRLRSRPFSTRFG